MAPPCYHPRAVTSDEELLEAWCGGNRNAGETLLRRHFDPLLAFFRRKLDDPGVVADLVQRTMLATLRGREGFRADASFRSWLFAIARNELFHELRRMKKHPELVDFGEVSVAELSGMGPNTMLGKLQNARLLLEALRRIPLDLQIAIELTYWEGLSATEVAAVLDIKVGTVKSRIRLAREKLQKAMLELGSAVDEVRETVDNLDGWAARVRDAALGG
jgi:RNA polymerase sigma-70 factor (ECF subfamily)